MHKHSFAHGKLYPSLSVDIPNPCEFDIYILGLLYVYMYIVICVYIYVYYIYLSIYI